jgi:hypothetical protein
MTLLQFSADGTFGKKYDFTLGSDKVLKIVSTLIDALEKDGYGMTISQRILAYYDNDDDSEPTFDLVNGDES